MKMFDLNLQEYDESSDDVLNELDRIKKTDTIPIKDIVLNPLNPEIDDDLDIIEFADKIYHSDNGVIESISVYRMENGKYMLLSGHKRIKACRYNIQHESELDGSGKVQKVVFANILEKPKTKEEELNMILDFNDYRRLETFEEKYRLFLPYYQVVALMIKNNTFKGRIREYISKRSGLGLKVVGECIKQLENEVYDHLKYFQHLVNYGKLQLSDKKTFLESRTHLPEETIELVLRKMKDNLEDLKSKEEQKKEQDRLRCEYQSVSDNLTKYLDVKCKVTPTNNITIKCGTVDQLNEVLKKIGAIQ